MRAVILSDDHGRADILEKILKLQKTADFVIHLGDSKGTIKEVMPLFPEKEFICVSGNCDMGIGFPAETQFFLEGVSIFATHGHHYGVTNGSLGLLSNPKIIHGANVVLFGHTHCRFEYYTSDTVYFNPGSCSSCRDGNPPSYGILDIVHGNPMLAHAQIYL